MRRFGLLLLLSAACGGRGPASTTETSSGEASSSDNTSNWDGAPTLDVPSSGEGPESGTTEMGSCESNGDCPPGMLCLHGDCQLDCGEANVILEAPPPQVLWVVDRSASMATASWDHDDDPNTPNRSRWDQAHAFIEELAGNYAATFNQGLIWFPAENACGGAPECFDESACQMSASAELPFSEVPSQGFPNLANALNTQHNSGPLLAGSPGVAAFDLARTTVLDSIAGGDARHAIAFVTDGGLNCTQGDCVNAQDCPLLLEQDSHSPARSSLYTRVRGCRPM